MLPLVKLTKLIASHDLLYSVVTNQIAFDHQDSKSVSTCNFECVMKQCCQALVSKLETLDTINFNQLWYLIVIKNLTVIKNVSCFDQIKTIDSILKRTAPMSSRKKHVHLSIIKKLLLEPELSLLQVNVLQRIMKISYADHQMNKAE